MGLLSFLFGSKPTTQTTVQSGGLLGGGDMKAYRDYAIDQQSQGKQPLAFADWQKMQQAQQAQPKPTQ